MIPIKLQFGLWIVAISGFLFGIPERVISLCLDGWYSSQDLIQLFTAIGFATVTLALNPLWRE